MSKTFNHKKVPVYDIDYDKLDYDVFRHNTEIDENAQEIKIITWNVNGIRSNILKDCKCKELGLGPNIVDELDASVGLGYIIEQYEPHLIFIQETRASVIKLNHINIEGWDIIAAESQKEGNKGPNNKAGTAIFYRNDIFEPQTILTRLPGVDSKDDEGNFTAFSSNIGDKELWFINVYVPNSGSNAIFRKEWDSLLLSFTASLDNVIMSGDFNVNRSIYDMSRTKHHIEQIEKEKKKGKLKDHLDLALLEPNYVDKVYTDKRNAGFLPSERKAFETLLTLFTDSWRSTHHDKWWEGYTFKSTLSKMKERIDYHLLKSSNIGMEIIKCESLENVGGSDHFPLFINLRIS